MYLKRFSHYLHGCAGAARRGSMTALISSRTPSPFAQYQEFKTFTTSQCRLIHSETFSADANSNSINVEDNSFDLDERLVGDLVSAGITTFFPVQAKTLQHTLKGEDVVVRSKTGSGKTLAFAVPVIHRLRQQATSRFRGRAPRALILSPTRELAQQIATECRRVCGDLRVACVFGGASYNVQQQQLAAGVDILVATPGRLLDLFERGDVDFNDIHTYILDEADEILKVGFAKEVEAITASLPADRATQLWSATMPDWVRNLAHNTMRNPVLLNFVGTGGPALPVGVTPLAYICEDQSRLEMCSALVEQYVRDGRVLVFANTRSDVAQIAQTLTSKQAVPVAVLSGSMSQAERNKNIHSFRTGHAPLLIATDVAARGLDISGVTAVIHYELPRDKSAFVHRSGRTARAGATGISICLIGDSDAKDMLEIERDLGFQHELRSLNPLSATLVEPEEMSAAAKSIKTNIASAQKPGVKFDFGVSAGMAARQTLQTCLDGGFTAEQVALALLYDKFNKSTQKTQCFSAITGKPGVVTLKVVVEGETAVSSKVQREYLKVLFDAGISASAVELRVIDQVSFVEIRQQELDKVLQIAKSPEAAAIASLEPVHVLPRGLILNRISWSRSAHKSAPRQHSRGRWEESSRPSFNNRPDFQGIKHSRGHGASHSRPGHREILEARKRIQSMRRSRNAFDEDFEW